MLKTKFFKNCQTLFKIKWLSVFSECLPQLQAGLNDQPRHTQINKTIENGKKIEDSGTFTEVEYKYNDSAASHDYALMHTQVY